MLRIVLGSGEMMAYLKTALKFILAIPFGIIVLFGGFTLLILAVPYFAIREIWDALSKD